MPARRSSSTANPKSKTRRSTAPRAPGRARKNASLASTNGEKKPPKVGVGLQQHIGESQVSADIKRLLGVFNPQNVTTDTRLLMMRDPILAFGLGVIRAPIMNLKWGIESEVPLIRDTVTKVIDRVYRELSAGLSLAVPLGCSVVAPEWMSGPLVVDVEDKVEGKTAKHRFENAWMYDRMKSIDIRTIDFLIDEAADRWAGIEQTVTGLKGAEKKRVGTDRAFLWSFRKEDVFGDLRGFPILDHAYEPWWWSAALQLMANRYFERKADPPMKGRAPDEGIETDGIPVDSRAWLTEEALALKGGSVLVLPSEFNTTTNQFLFDLEYMQAPERGDMYQLRLDALDIAKLRSIWVTDKAATSGDGEGSMAQASVHAETMAGMLEVILSEFLNVVNCQVIPPVVRWLFGEEAVQSSRTRMVGSGIGQAEMERLKEILMKLLESEELVAEGVSIKLRDRINGTALATKLGLDLVPADDLKKLAEKQEEKRAEEARAFTQGQGGVDDGGEVDDKAVADDLQRRGNLDD